MSDDLLWDFFADDVERVKRAVVALGERSSGAVTTTETFSARKGEDALRVHDAGILSPTIFEGGRWGHLDVVSLVHPIVYLRWYESNLHEVLGGDAGWFPRVVRGTHALRDLRATEGKWAFGSRDDFDSDDDLTGPAGLAEALRRTDPSHPFLPLCSLSRVPIPPRGARPLAPKESAWQVDPWVGPLNEAWLDLVHRSSRERILVEAEAPPSALTPYNILVHRAFEHVFRATRLAARRLLPALAFVPEELEESEVRGLAFVGSDRLVVQRRDGVSLLDLEGVERLRLPACGTQLRGVVADRYAVFEGTFLQTSPTMVGKSSGYGPEVFTEGEDGCFKGMELIEVSVIDCQSGALLERPPPEVPLRLLRLEQVEEVFVEDEDPPLRRRILFEGESMEVSAYAPGMTHALVRDGDSDELTVVEVVDAVPHAYVAESTGAATRLPLLGNDTDAQTDDDDDDEERSPMAIAFLDGRWHVLGVDGTLADHRGRDAVKLVPQPERAAFDPSGRTLAVIVRDELVTLDVARRTIVERRSIRWLP